MKKRFTTCLLIAVFTLTGATVHGGPLTIPNTFVPGTKANAADVNANFQAVKIAVDNNDSRISNLEAVNWKWSWESTNITITGTDCNVLSTTITAPKDGFVSITGSGYFTIDHVLGTADATRVCLTTVSGVLNTQPFFTIAEIPKDWPSGVVHIPFSIEGVFNITQGTQTYYMVADVYDGTGYSTSQQIGRRQLTVTYIPIK